MKPFQFLLLFSAILFLNACGNKVVVPESVIVGKYVVQTIRTEGCNDPSENDDGADYDIECVVEGRYNVCRSISLEFTNDTEYIFSYDKLLIDKFIGAAYTERDAQNGYFSIDGNSLNLCFNGVCEMATFTREGNTLNLRIEKANGCVQLITAKLD